VGTRSQWDALAARLRETANPFDEPEVAELWAIACEEAPRVLASYRRSGRLDGERIADLTRDLLVNSLPDIVAAANPQAYFVTALVNAARSWLRRGGSRVVSAPEAGATPDDKHPKTSAPDHALRIDAVDFLQTLSDRERTALIGVAHGEDRTQLATVLGISRTNLDQIVSRARKRFRAGEP
jgi:RNA polymerase sigma factor (sigma-70 family)